MKLRLSIMIMLVILFPLNIFPARFTGDYFSTEEMEILAATSKSIGFDFGYDFDMNLVYIFTNTFNKDDAADKNKKFTALPEKITKEALKKFYEKVFKLVEITSLKMERFKDQEVWKNYTYINKYLLPYLERYFKYLENEVLAGDQAYKGMVAERKKALTQEAKRFVRDDEIREKIKSMEKKRRRRWNI